jgi:hypothetical protein
MAQFGITATLVSNGSTVDLLGYRKVEIDEIQTACHEMSTQLLPAAGDVLRIEVQALTPRTTFTADSMSGCYYGVPVFDRENCALAATCDRRRALAALHAHCRIAVGDRLIDWVSDPDRDFVSGWGWLEIRGDDNWLFCSADRPAVPQAFPATWLCL